MGEGSKGSIEGEVLPPPNTSPPPVGSNCWKAVGKRWESVVVECRGCCGWGLVEKREEEEVEGEVGMLLKGWGVG